MERHAIPREVVGSTGSQTKCQMPSHVVDVHHVLTGPQSSPQPNRDCTVDLHAAQDEHPMEDDDYGTELLPQTRYNSSTASGYTRVADDPAKAQTKYDTEVSMSLEEQTNLPKLHRGAIYHLRAWWHEVVWCLLAVGLLIALIILLRYYDRRPAPKWSNDLSLNTVVAIIATVCRALTVIPVSEGLSQLKWNSFARTQRPLEDLYTFDQASRGPFGSLALLVKLRGR